MGKINIWAKRSLYMCGNAKVMGSDISCAKGHRLNYLGRPSDSSEGLTISINRLKRGQPLELTICQACEDYDELGPPVPQHERGWLKTLY